MITTILTFILVFSILVVFHEYGHYYFAKKSGILVREFAIGFGPKIFSYRKNETTYTVRLLPLADMYVWLIMRKTSRSNQELQSA